MNDQVNSKIITTAQRFAWFAWFFPAQRFAWFFPAIGLLGS